MKTKEWKILGFFFVILGAFFIYLDRTLSMAFPCNINMEQSVWFSCQTLSEIYDPFIWTFYAIAVICFVMAFINRKEK